MNRKNDALKLSRSEEKFRALFQNNVAPIVMTDDNGRFLDVNHAACALYGYDKDQLLSMKVADLVTVSPKAASAAFETYMRGGPSEGEIEFLRPDGSRTAALWSAKRISEGIHACVLRDITPLREADKRLRFEKQRAQLYLDIAAVMLLGLDIEGRIALLNRAGCALLGFSDQSDALGITWFDFIPEKDRESVKGIFTAIVRGEIEGLETVESIVLNVAGEERRVRWRNAIVRDEAGAIIGTLSSGEDVTQQRLLEFQLAQSDRLSSMGMLAAGVAHEINNPLSYILYNLETVCDLLPETLRRAQQPTLFTQESRPAPALQQTEPVDIFGNDMLALLAHARDGAYRIRDISRCLGTFSRVEKDQLQPVSLNSVIEVAINMAFNEVKYRARLVKNLGKIPLVLASEGRLSQVFLNLLINAAHAIPEGDVDNNEIRMTTWSEAGDVCAEVRDTGSGIAAGDLPNLFEPFFTTKEIGRGSGLGLAISKSIIDGYKGTITVSSEVNRGSAFTVRLPVLSDRWTIDAPKVATDSIQPLPGRILIVDDEADIRSTLARILSSHEITEARSGAEAMRILEADSGYDVIVSDMMMSNVSGMDLHRWLRKTHAKLADNLVFITGGAFTPKARDYLKTVENVRFEKPLDIANFKKIVDTLVRESLRNPAPA